ncbi:polyprenyl synthetase, partial [gut metagenome]
MRTLEEYIDLAEQAMTTIAYPSEPNGLYEPIAYGLSNGGKRLRPAILLAACEAVGKDCT